MNMNRHQIILAAAGSVFAVAFCSLAYFLYSSVSDRNSVHETLKSDTASIQRFYGERIFPCRQSLDAVKSNETSLAAWRDSARSIAGRGDRILPAESSTAFKQRLQSEVRRMIALPGGVDGRLSAPSFLFGFDKYLGDNGGLPDPRDTPKLAVELDLISHIIEICSESGVLEVKAVKRDETSVAQEKATKNNQRRSNVKVDKKGASTEPTHLAYSFTFLTKPDAFVRVMNALASDTRFIVVTDFSFSATADRIVDALSARDAASNKKNNARSSRRRGATSADTSAEQDKNKEATRLVIDPELDSPVQVELSLEVYDFGSAESGTQGDANATASGKPKAEVSK